MYKTVFNCEMSRLRDFPVEQPYTAQDYIELPQQSLADVARQRVAQTLIALGSWIDPRQVQGQARRQTTAWQGH